jgi:hypothetical protein
VGHICARATQATNDPVLLEKGDSLPKRRSRDTEDAGQLGLAGQSITGLEALGGYPLA